MNALHIPGVTFRPIYAKPFYAVFQGEQVQGVQIHFADYSKAPLSDLNFLLMQEEARLYPDHKVFEQANQGRYAMFDKVCGSSYIRETFLEVTVGPIFATIGTKMQNPSAKFPESIIYISN